MTPSDPATLTNDSVDQVVDALAQLDMVFLVRHGCPHGMRELTIRPEDVSTYARDPAAFLASHYNVSKSNYLGWHGDDYNVYCAALTRSGKQCRNVVEGGIRVEPVRWVELQGGYCHVHESGTER